jgi:hypothetical protein
MVLWGVRTWDGSPQRLVGWLSKTELTSAALPLFFFIIVDLFSPVAASP